jgi:SAM-dependent methyltransferase
VLAPLVIHYVENFLPLFTELARILKMDGLFIFSTHQPHTEFQNRKLDDYYKKVLITDLWKEPEIEVQYYHHTLHELTESLYQAGFVIERMLEPMPMTHLETAAPEMFKQITTQPWFLFVRAKKVLRTSKDNV